MHNVLKYDSCTAQYLVIQKRIFMFLILYYISCLLKSQLLWNSQKSGKIRETKLQKKNTFEAKHYSFHKVHSNWILSHCA